MSGKGFKCKKNVKAVFNPNKKLTLRYDESTTLLSFYCLFVIFCINVLYNIWAGAVNNKKQNKKN